jgi:hypothetical protein
MSRITMDSKCFKHPNGVKIHKTEKERIENRVPQSSVTHNQIAARECSRRKKITVQDDNMLDRANLVRNRLRKKLANKKINKKK